MLENILENFHFLTIEAENQVKLTYGLVSEFNPELLEKIVSKDDYIDNLKTTVENTCFSTIYSMPEHITREQLNDIRAIHIICVNLERIADYCVNTGRQLKYLSDISFIQQYDYKAMFSQIREAISDIMRVFRHRDLSGALVICRAECELDRLYKLNFDLMLGQLEQGGHPGDLITGIFIFRYLERIGDSILNIGEALIFAIIGDRIKIRQIDALEQTLRDSGFHGTLADVDFSSIWGSRSGCRISKVGDKKPEGFRAEGIFKEGAVKKIRKERENIRKWDEILPGLAPRIFGYHEKTNTASLLVEFLPGATMDQVVLTESPETIRNVIDIFGQTVDTIWTKTLRQGEAGTDYMAQLRSRLEAVRQVHPRFFRETRHIGPLCIPSSAELIDACERIEAGIPAPFTIFIHGDFNTNNVVCNLSREKINYIDLYRSREADYVQDASVFLASFFRLPVFDVRLRNTINNVIRYFYRYFSEFAKKQNDTTFDIRMALALARSFYTSTRFELNYSFAREMFLRSHFLMEKMASHEGNPWNEFKLPESILYY